MKTYTISLNILSLAPQLNQDIIINGVNVGRPIEKLKLVKAVKAAFPLLSLPKVLDIKEGQQNKRQLFSMTVLSYRPIKDINIQGISKDFVVLEVKEIVDVKV